MKRTRQLLTLVFACYLMSAVLLYLNQRDFLYAPTPEYQHDYHTREFANEGEVLKSVVLWPDQEHAIIYFGGNGESIVHSAGNFNWLDMFPGRTIYLLNYRGYGGSTGKPSEKALYSDALAIYDELSPNHTKISLIGRSLGSGVATYLAANRDIDSLTLITPYDSIQSVAQKRFPIYPMSILLRDKYNSLSRVGEVTAKTLIITAENDSVIPNEHSRKLIDAFPTHQTQVKTIENSGHNNLSNTQAYYATIRTFINNN